MLVLRAACDMKEDTEVTIAYQIAPTLSETDLEGKFQNWEFVCDCTICEYGRATSTAVAAQRENRLKQLSNLSNAPGPVKASTASLLLESIEGTYSKLADEVPRLQIWNPLMGVAQYYVKQGTAHKFIEWAVKMLSSLEFIVTGADHSPAPFVFAKWGHVDEQILVIFPQMNEAFQVLGFSTKARQTEKCAQVMFKIVVGEDDTYEEGLIGTDAMTPS